jgi:uncharacterized protein (DUF58 family)
MPARLRERLRRWWHDRLPATDSLILDQRNVYIVPSAAGWMLAATLAVLLVASINYQLNLGYLLTFLLAGSVAAGMHMTHGNLRGLRLLLTPPDPQFAGASATLHIVLANDRKAVRHGIGLAVHDGPAPTPWVWADVPAQGSAAVQVAFQPGGRGLHPVPTLTAQTRYPLGAFRVWTLWRPATQVLVYPSPEALPPPLPPTQPLAGASAVQQRSGSGDFEGVRAYRRGDTLRSVVWKKAAKTGELVSRDTGQARREELWLDHGLAGGADLERRLSRLAAWVLQAEKLGLDYGLRLPGREIAPDSGEAHKRRCLEALALC